MKTPLISGLKLGEKGKNGWIINHEGTPVAISFTPNQGDVLIRSRQFPTGVCIRGSSVQSVRISDKPGRTYIKIFYVARLGESDEMLDEMELGEVPRRLREEAIRFVESVQSAFGYSAQLTER